MARQTLAEVKKERDDAIKELDAFKKKVEKEALEFHEGCMEGKLEFLELIGLRSREDTTVTITIDLTVKEFDEACGKTPQELVEEWFVPISYDIFSGVIWVEVGQYPNSIDFEFGIEADPDRIIVGLVK
jgi:hypothetical protein